MFTVKVDFLPRVKANINKDGFCKINLHDIPSNIVEYVQDNYDILCIHDNGAGMGYVTWTDLGKTMFLLTGRKLK